MTTTFMVILALLIFPSLNSGNSYTSAGKNTYRYFQVDKYLFACNSTHYWHVFSSEADKSIGNNSEEYGIRFNMVGPHRLMEDEKEKDTAKDFNKTQKMSPQLKFVFVGQLEESCTVLVLVDSVLNYQLGSIHMNKNVSEAISTFKAPFHLHKLVKDDSCGGGQTKLPESTGHLSTLPFFSEIFGEKNAKTLVSSVFNLEHSSVLYVLGTGGNFFNVHLHKNWTSSTQHQLLKPLERRLLDRKIVTLYSRESGQKKFMLLQSDDGNGTIVCPVISLSPSLQLGSACKVISTYNLYDKQQLKLRTGFEGSDDKHNLHLLQRIHNGTDTTEKVCDGHDS